MPNYEGVILDEGGAVYNVNAFPTVHDAVSAAVAAGRGIVFFPPGIYSIAAPIILEGRSDIRLVGAGPNATQLVQANNDGVIVIRDNGTVASKRISIQGFWIGISEGMPRAGGVGIAVNSSISEPASAISIKDVELMNVPYPFSIDNVHQSEFENIRVVANIATAVKGTLFSVKNCISIRIRNCNSVVPVMPAGKYPVFAMYIEGDCDTVVVSDCELGDCEGIGVLLGGGTSGPRLVRLDNVYVERCGSAGFCVANGRDVRMNGCHAAVNAGCGFHLSGGNSVSIVNSLSLQNDLHGFFISGNGDRMLRGSAASNNSQAADSTYSGCYIEQDTANIQVSDNRLGDFIFTLNHGQAYGLVVGSGAANIIGTSNNLKNNKTGGLLGTSSATVILQNNLS